MVAACLSQITPASTQQLNIHMQTTIYLAPRHTRSMAQVWKAPNAFQVRSKNGGWQYPFLFSTLWAILSTNVKNQAPYPANNIYFTTNISVMNPQGIPITC